MDWRDIGNSVPRYEPIVVAMIGRVGDAITVSLKDDDVVILAFGDFLGVGGVEIIAKVKCHAFALKLFLIIAYDEEIFKRTIEECVEFAHKLEIAIGIVAFAHWDEVGNFQSVSFLFGDMLVCFVFIYLINPLYNKYSRLYTPHFVTTTRPPE